MRKTGALLIGCVLVCLLASSHAVQLKSRAADAILKDCQSKKVSKGCTVTPELIGSKQKKGGIQLPPPPEADAPGPETLSPLHTILALPCDCKGKSDEQCDCNHILEMQGKLDAVLKREQLQLNIVKKKLQAAKTAVTAQDDWMLNADHTIAKLEQLKKRSAKTKMEAQEKVQDYKSQAAVVRKKIEHDQVNRDVELANGQLNLLKNKAAKQLVVKKDIIKKAEATQQKIHQIHEKLSEAISNFSKNK